MIYSHSFSSYLVQAVIPPDSKSNYDLHLEYSVRDLKSYKQNMAVDVVYIYPPDHIPTGGKKNQVDPRKIKDDLTRKFLIFIFYSRKLNLCFSSWIENLDA